VFILSVFHIMSKCVQCPSVFNHKNNLTVHKKKHAGVRFPCTVCVNSFNEKSNLNRHLKCVHGILCIFDLLSLFIFPFVQY